MSRRHNDVHRDTILQTQTKCSTDRWTEEISSRMPFTPKVRPAAAAEQDEAAAQEARADDPADDDDAAADEAEAVDAAEQHMMLQRQTRLRGGRGSRCSSG